MTIRKNKSKPQKSDSLFQDFKGFTPMTDNQSIMEEEFQDGASLVVKGSAGTGKTFVALALALREVVEGRARCVQIIRSAVATRDQGFLPGDAVEKMAVYERPYIKNVNRLFGRDDAYGILKLKGFLVFESTSFLRGDTFDDTVIVVDEMENLDESEMNTIMTRLGKNSRIILTGDIIQADIRHEDSGFHMLMDVIPHMQHSFAIITMTHDDIVRNPIVKDWIINCEKYSSYYTRHTRR